MTTPLELPAYKEVSAAFSYDPLTGVLTRLSTGKPAGSLTAKGYLRVRYNGPLYYVHRLAWLLHYKEPPRGSIDHVDGIGSHNAISNLRDLTHAINMQNQRSPRRTNKARLLGVSATRYGTFQSEISCGGDRVFLGTFSTAEEAHEAYIAKKRLIHIGSTL
jgi:hypothetical protein